MERFWSKVQKGGPDECWEWQAGRHKFGHGKFRLPTGHIGSHRMAWQLTYGPIPPGMWVLHHCDNPPCCNPRHLYLGTAQDNTRDREVRGRHPHPAKDVCKYGHVLTDDNVYVTYPPSHKGRPFRQCRLCMNRRQREYHARKTKGPQT